MIVTIHNRKFLCQGVREQTFTVNIYFFALQNTQRRRKNKPTNYRPHAGETLKEQEESSTKNN